MIYYYEGVLSKEEQHRKAYELLAYGMKEEYGFSKLPEIGIGDRGKPYFKEVPVSFNLSHTGHGAACVISKEACGIDIQDIAGKITAARRVCSEGEKAKLKSAANPARLFTRYWTLKEALVKCTGEGITNQMANYDFARFEGDYFTDQNRQFAIFETENFIISVCYVQNGLKLYKVRDDIDILL